MRASSLLLFALCVGCATNYGPMGQSGGYEEMRIEENLYRVTFKANAFSEMHRARDFAMLRAAEIGETLGYEYMAIHGAEDKTSIMVTPGPATTTHSGTAYTSGGYTSYSGNSTTYPSTMAFPKPGISLLVEYFHEAPDGFIDVRRCVETAAEIREQRKIRVE